MGFCGLICFQYNGGPCCPQAVTRSKSSIIIQGLLLNLKLVVIYLESTTMDFCGLICF